MPKPRIRPRQQRVAFPFTLRTPGDNRGCFPPGPDAGNSDCYPSDVDVDDSDCYPPGPHAGEDLLRSLLGAPRRRR